ncbi:hypothetical protein NIES21_00810 [Anabaenopsis circularis NIES-21]|uniref:Uncharacterized protein n=1 Tax=Anabaenopsis circularis NIES-21 TaxID=1085406 RepID=A0A1Z4G9Y2_9CYAN|nr:hypothetical protein NIES21_00810 [Anabaenopsis circularis NIES-21]
MYQYEPPLSEFQQALIELQTALLQIENSLYEAYHTQDKLVISDICEYLSNVGNNHKYLLEEHSELLYKYMELKRIFCTPDNNGN